MPPKKQHKGQEVNPADLLAQAQAEYQQEVSGAFAAAELEQAKAEYQRAMSAEFERLTAPAAAATAPAKKKKVRASYPDAEGKSANGFSLRMITGQIDQAMVDFKRQNGNWPSAEVVANLIHADAKRVAAHIAWWQSPENTPHRGRGPFYL